MVSCSDTYRCGETTCEHHGDHKEMTHRGSTCCKEEEYCDMVDSNVYCMEYIKLIKTWEL